MANRYTATNAPELLLESGVDPSLWPTEYQLERFGEFITQPIDVDGEWWAGSCPFHGGANSAWFNWRRGVYRCMAEDVEDPCHYPGKSQTLTNIVDMIKFTGSKHVAIIKRNRKRCNRYRNSWDTSDVQPAKPGAGGDSWPRAKSASA